jgi:peptide/nickel transport system permease protein
MAQSGAIAVPAEQVLPRRKTRTEALLTLAKRKPLGTFGAAIVVLLLVMAIGANVIAPYPPLETNEANRLQGPSASHLAGTDQFGRDIFSRLIHGARTSLYVGTAVMVVSTIPAIILGLMGAFYGGWIDYAIGRLVDVIQAIPQLVLLISIMVILGPSMINVIFALSFRRAVTESRVLRGATLSIKNQTYVEAARCLGAGNWWIMLRYLLPNIMPTVIILTSIGYAGVILSEASLSFLGYGIPPPAPSWGGMLAADGRAYMFAAPWMLFGPAIALAVVVYGVNMFGDSLRDILDPRLRGS